MTAELILAVAIALSGECGPVGDGCELAVARTMCNRLLSDAFPDDWEGVLAAYYGQAKPTAEAVVVANLAVTAPALLADGRHCYAYGEVDVRRLGWRRGDEVRCGGGLCLHLSYGWPGKEE